MVEQILEYGEVRQAGIGVVSLTGYRKMMLGRYGYDVNDGVVIESVENGGPAAKAGLRGLQEDPRVGIRIGDVITAVNNKKVKNYDDLYNILSEKKVGETVKIEYRRMGRILSKDITLELIKVKS